MLRIITANLNGIRSAWRKGFGDWLACQKADVVCLQELKAHAGDLTAEMLAPAGLHAHFAYALKKGYSGVGVFSRRRPDRVVCGFASSEFDDEGRYVQADFGRLSVVSLYLPSGSSSEARQQAKFRCMDQFLRKLRRLRRSGREVVICGDWNIAHREIDLTNWRSNRRNSGFLPEERAWFTKVLDQVGWVDVYRRLHPDATGESYTWWSNRGQAWLKNVGWRIDYHIATPELAATARRAAIWKETRFSDHAPLTIDYAWKG